MEKHRVEESSLLLVFRSCWLRWAVVVPGIPDADVVGLGVVGLGVLCLLGAQHPRPLAT